MDAWRRLRTNLACIDTLLIDPAGTALRAEAGRVSMSRLFPALKRGAAVVLGNPPYADLGRRSDLAGLGRVFESLAVKPEPNAEIYPAFVEQMIRLADGGPCSGALVLPLSVACNVGAQFSKTRELISKTRGRWSFAFFDREPHALFGEDVKTRNAIVLWTRTPSDTKPVLATGPLRKWRGDSRAAMFRSLGFTVVDGDIRAGIPKIEGSLQAAALKALSMRWGRLEQVAQSIERVDLAETRDADDRTVFVGATAYNFVNVFLKPPGGVLRARQGLSEHPLHAVRCASRTDALGVFAILSSHLAYWWWHTHGDGFHVSRRFIAELPFGSEDLNGDVTGALSEHGAALWSAIKAKPVISLNRGSTSLAYTPNGHDDMRRKTDEVLADLARLEGAFVDELQQFTAHTVAATLRTHKVTATEEKETA
ncbi:MAG: Eco57I restriction-modification methylase domain-containing protein [Acidobacteria bacterium]|nr:Eco57I restriction-modification methylase domain-containing protein [Acidobacteriota bacterium]